MADYSNYPYGRMLKYIESQSIQRRKDSHLNYILSMEKAESMAKLIEIYNHTFQYMAILFFGTQRVPDAWYDLKTWGNNKEYLLEELNYFLNENILHWFERLDNPTNEDSLSAISNLRQAKNTDDIESKLLNLSNPKAYNGVKILIYNRRRLHLLRERSELLTKPYFINQYLSCAKYLAAHGYLFDIIEISIGEDYNISYDNLKEQFQEEIKAQEAEKRAEKKKATLRTVCFTLFCLILLTIFFIISSYIGGMGLIIIIGWIGMLPKILLKGKI